MIGMILVTHNNIGGEMLRTLNEIVGEQAQAQALAIGLHDNMETCRDKILAAIKNVNKGDGVILLVDLFGGTPSNLAIASMATNQTVVLAGVNMPMLIKLATARRATLRRRPFVSGLGHQRVLFRAKRGGMRPIAAG